MNIITLPFAALLRWLYEFTSSYGVSIILFALVIKLIFLPFQMKGKKGMMRMGTLSKRQQELQKQYANNQRKYQEEVQKLYQEEGVNPMSGCLWSFLPLLILMPLYSIVYRPITHFMGLSETALETLRETAVSLGFTATGGGYEQIFLTDFIHQNWDKFQGTVEGLIDVNFSFLNLDLSRTPTSMFSGFTFDWGHVGVILIPILAAGMQLLSTMIMSRTSGQSPEQARQMRTMNLMMPLISLWFCFTMPAAMGVYWIVNSVFMTIQEATLGRYYTKKFEAEEAERQAKREAARQLRMEEARKRSAEQKELEAKKPKKPAPKPVEKKVSTSEAGRVGERPYARGRSYREDRYNEKE